MMDMGYKDKVCPASLGIGFGVAKGLSMLIMALLAMAYGVGIPVVANLATLYSGYAPTLMGAVKGGLWGLFDGYVFGLVLGLVYNLCRCCMCKCRCGKDGCKGCCSCKCGKPGCSGNCSSSCKCGSPSCPACNSNR